MGGQDKELLAKTSRLQKSGKRVSAGASGGAKQVKGGSIFSFVPTGAMELKRQTAALTDTWSSVGTTAVYSSVGTLGQGLEFNQRIGRRVKFNTLEIEGDLQGGQSNLATDDAYNSFRIIVYRANVSWSAIPAMGVNDMVGPEDNAAIEDVLYDRLFLLVSQGRNSTGYLPVIKHVRISIPVKHIQTYSGTTSSTMSGSVINIAMCSDSSAVTHPGFINGIWRLTYSDY